MSIPVPLNAPELLHHFPDPVMAFDVKERFVAWNPAAERVYGLPAGQAIGQSVWLIVPRRKPRPFVRACEQTRQAGQWAGELITLAANGSVRIVDARWSVTGDGVIVAVHTEVGERRKHEAADRRADRWAAARALAGAAADSLPAAAGPSRQLLAHTGYGADPVADPVYHGNGAWVLVAIAEPLAREVGRAVLDAAGYTVLVANDRSTAKRQAEANHERLRAVVLGFGTDTPHVTKEVRRYRAMLPVVPLDAGFHPTRLLQQVAEAVGQDQVFDPDTEVI